MQKGFEAGGGARVSEKEGGARGVRVHGLLGLLGFLGLRRSGLQSAGKQKQSHEDAEGFRAVLRPGLCVGGLPLYGHTCYTRFFPTPRQRPDLAQESKKHLHAGQN